MGHTISRKIIKRMMTILTAAVLVLIPVGGSIRQVHAEGEGGSDSGMSLEHEKTVTENADGTYDLKLTVKGKVNSQSSKVPLDVIYILDRSGSMDYRMNSNNGNNGERRKSASEAINNMTDTLAGNSNLDVRFALVTFSGDKPDEMGWPPDKQWNDSKVAVNWTNQASVIKEQTLPSSEGGTNYQAGIRSAKELLGGKRQNAKTAVIFISDGNPTYRYGNDGYTQGNGYNDEGSKNLQAAKDAVSDMQTDYFFTVGVGPEINYQNLRDLSNAALNAESKNFYAGTTLSNLNQAFDDIQSVITKLACRKVSISDPLSENVEIVKGTDGKVLTPQVQIYNAAGNTIDATALGITAVYDEAARTVRLQFPQDYQLEDGYTYEVTAKIQPTEKAYETYRTSGYTDVADEGTGTYAGKEGFYSNQNENATLSYEYKGINYTELYKKPVVRIYPGSLTVSKVITGLEDNPEALQNVIQNLSFTCSLTKPDGTVETKNLKLGEQGLVWDTSQNAYVYTVSNLTPGTTYEVTENDAELNGYDLTATPDNRKLTGQIARGTQSRTEFVNQYIRSDRMLTIEKEVGGNMGDRTHAFSFKVRTRLNGKNYTSGIRYVKYDAQGNPLGEDELKDAVKVENGVYTFQLKHMEKIEMTIPYGVEYTVSEDPEDYGVKITKSGEELENGKKEVADTLLENTNLKFTNTKEIQPATGIRQNSVPYLVMTGAAFGMLVFFGMVYGIRKWVDLTED